MALNADGTNMTGAVCDGTTLNVIQCDGTYVWVRAYTLSISADAGVDISVYISSSKYAGITMSSDQMGNGSTVHYGDVIGIRYSLNSGYTKKTATITVSGTTTELTGNWTFIEITGAPSVSATSVLERFTFKVTTKKGATAESPIKSFKVTRTSCPTGLGSTGEIMSKSNTSGTTPDGTVAIYKGDVLTISFEEYTTYYRCVDFSINGTSYTTNSATVTVSGDVTCTLVTMGYGSSDVWSIGSNTANLVFDGSTITGATGTVGNLEFTHYKSYSIVKRYNGEKIFVQYLYEPYATGYLAPYVLVYDAGPIRTIAAGAFKNNQTVGTLKITTDGALTTIGDEAFRGSSISGIVTGSSCSKLTSIGHHAFADTNLTGSDICYYLCSNSSITIGTGAFCTKNGWSYSGLSKAKAQKLVASRGSSSSDGTCYAIRAAGYDGVQLGKGGGNNGVGGSINFEFHWNNSKFSNGYYSKSQSISSYSTGQHKVSEVYAIACDNNGSFTVSMHIISNSLSNYSSASYSITTSWNACGTSTSASVTNNGSCNLWHIDFSYTTTCLTEHTLLTLANGSRKRADQITYKDLLLCYNFETGKQDYQYPLSITKGKTHDHFTRIHLENNLYIDICGHHDIYDPKAHLFRTYGDGHILSTVLKDYYILDDSGQTVKIKSIERVEKEVTAYCIITSGVITAYADTVMIGMSHMNFGRIDSTNKFSKEFETDKLICYDYNTFKEEVYDEEEQDLIIGTCLHFVHYYNKDGSGLGRLLNPLKRRIPLPKYKNKNLYTLGFIDKELTEMQSVEDEIIVLPEIKSKGKTKWYIVGEYKYLNPGDTYITKFSTVIRAV